VRGNLRLAETQLEEVSLPLLQKVSGLLWAQTGRDLPASRRLTLRRVHLPALVESGRIGFSHILDVPSALVELSLPRLTRVHGQLMITKQQRLERLDLSGLQEVGGYFFLFGVRAQACALRALRLPRLRRVGANLEIGNQTGLVELELPRLAHVGESLRIGIFAEGGDIGPVVSPNPLLTRIVLPALEVVESELHVAANDRLVAIEAPRLERARSVTVRRNPMLTQLELPRLTSVGKLVIEDRPRRCAIGDATAGDRFAVPDACR
jgi:hypothetical protein